MSSLSSPATTNFTTAKNEPKSNNLFSIFKNDATHLISLAGKLNEEIRAFLVRKPGSSGMVSSNGSRENAFYELGMKNFEFIDEFQALVGKVERYRLVEVKIEKAKAAKKLTRDELVNRCRAVRNIGDEVERELVEVARPLLGESYVIDGDEEVVVKSKEADPKDLLEYAKKLSYTVAAPPGWNSETMFELPVPFKPPMPQQEHMKQGILFTSIETLVQNLHYSNEMKRNINETEIIREMVTSEENDAVEVSSSLLEGDANLLASITASAVESASIPHKKVDHEFGSMQRLDRPPSMMKMRKRETTFDLGISSSETEGSEGSSDED